MEAAIFSDTTDQTFDVGEIPQQYRGSMTRVEDFIRMRTRASALD